MKINCRQPAKSHKVNAADADQEDETVGQNNYFYEGEDDEDEDAGEQTGFVGTLKYLN